MPDPRRQTARERYESLKIKRNPFLSSARNASELTLPGLIPPEGHQGVDLPDPFQSVGARGTNNLGAKLLLALFPPQGAFFRLQVDETVIDELQDQLGQDQDARAEVESALSGLERAIMRQIEQTNARAVGANGLKHLVVGGNYLFEVLPDANLKGHPLSDYVVERDLEGNPIEIVVLEELSRLSAPEPVREIVDQKQAEIEPSRKDDSADDSIKLYTRVSRDENLWRIHQEVEDIEVPGTRGTTPLDAPRYIPARFNPVDRESYGRGLAQEYAGDLQSLESLQQSIVEFAAAAAKILFLGDPGGVTDMRELRDARSGDFVEGDARDISVLALEKFPDFQTANAVKADIESRLEEAFLLNSSVQRDAERVTAEEIRFLAGELEQALGGVYSGLSNELQRPLVKRWMKVMSKQGTIPDLPDNLVEPKIIAGIDALGRASDLQRLDIFLNGFGTTFGPESVDRYINTGSYARRRAAALGIDPTGLVRSEEEVQQKIEEERQAALQAQAAGPAVQATGRLAEKAADIQTQPQQ